MKLAKILNINEELKLDDYYKFLMDKPNQKIKTYLDNNDIMIKTVAKETGINRHTFNQWFNHNKEISRKSYEKLKLSSIFDKIMK